MQLWTKVKLRRFELISNCKLFGQINVLFNLHTEIENDVCSNFLEVFQQNNVHSHLTSFQDPLKNYTRCLEI